MDNSFSFFRRQKRKRVTVDESILFVLNLKIHGAQGIDNPSDLYPSVSQRKYFVCCWVKPEERLKTITVKGRIDLCWNQNGRFLLGNSCDDYDFLYIEVVRKGPSNEPETSECYSIVGRARIPLPSEFKKVKRESFGLVRMKEGEIKCDGFIVLSMELLRLNPRYLYG